MQIFFYKKMILINAEKTIYKMKIKGNKKRSLIKYKFYQRPL